MNMGGGSKALASALVGTTHQRYEYDGLDRLTESVDSVDGILGDGNDWVNEYTWAALGRNKTQRQNNALSAFVWADSDST